MFRVQGVGSSGVCDHKGEGGTDRSGRDGFGRVLLLLMIPPRHGVGWSTAPLGTCSLVSEGTPGGSSISEDGLARG